MNILITGANGFVGRALCRRLSADGYKVRGLKNSLDYRFYDFVNFFEKGRWKLNQFVLKISTMAYHQPAFKPQKSLILR